MTFQSPTYLYLLLLLIPIISWYIWELRKSEASVKLSSLNSLTKQSRSLRIYLLHLPFLLSVAGIVLLTIALARPQLHDHQHQETTEGINIMMAIDISGTMLGEDLKPNRLEAAKEVACKFVNDRPNDNIGLVAFAGESFTQCPLTTDHIVLTTLFKSLQFGMIEDGTAIGVGLANAINRMKDSKTKSKVIILLTDGSNNRGEIDPIMAADIAKKYNIRIYTIGVGSYSKNVRATLPTPQGKQYAYFDSEFDEETLQQIAKRTDGQYFRATDNSSLENIYTQIDQLEKSRILVSEYTKHDEHFEPFLIAAALCLLLQLLLKWFVLRSITQ